MSCSINGCASQGWKSSGKEYFTNNLCRKHNRRLALYGDVDKFKKEATHGENRLKHPLYHTHKTMMQRCYDKNATGYSNYGGRGIQVCDRWYGVKNFQNFVQDMGPKPTPKHSIDRIDNDGDYTPENCRWATAKQQTSNTRVNRYITYNGVRRTVSGWARQLRISPQSLSKRLKKWSVDKALTKRRSDYSYILEKK